MKSLEFIKKYNKPMDRMITGLALDLSDQIKHRHAFRYWFSWDIFDYKKCRCGKVVLRRKI